MPLPPMPSMSRVNLWLLARRVWVLGLFLVLWGLAFLLTFSGAGMRTDNSTLAFFPDSDPVMARMAEAMDMAPFSRLLLVDFASTEAGHSADLAAVAEAVAGAVPAHLARRAAEFSLPDPLTFVRLVPALVDATALTELEAAARPEAMRAALNVAHKNLSGLWGSVAVPWLQQDPLNFRHVFLQKLPAPPGVSLSDPTLGFPVSPDGKHVLLTLRPLRSFHDVEAASALMNALNAALAAHVPPQMQVTVVGGHRHSAANAQIIQQDISRIVLFSLAGFASIYLVLVRSLRGMLWLLLTPVAAASLALAGVGLSWPVVSGLALGFGASVLGIAEDYAVHMHFALRHARGRGQDSRHAASHVLDALSLPLFQGFVLNATGFVVLLFSGIPALRHLAAFALFTLGAGLFLALFILPLCPGFDAPPITARAVMAARAPRFPRIKPALACAVLLLLLCGLGFSRVSMDISPRSLGAGVAAMQEDGALLKRVWGAESEQIWVVRGTNSAEALERARAVSAALRAQGQEVDSISDLWPAPEVMRENLQRWQDFVKRHPTLTQDLTALAVAQGFSPDVFAPLTAWLKESPALISAELLAAAGLQDMLDTFLEEDTDPAGKPRALALITVKSGAAPGVTPAPDLATTLPARLAPELPADLPPELATLAVALSPAALEAALLQHLSRERWLLPVAALLCLALLLLCLRSWRRALLAALPPLAALAAIVGWLALSGTELTLAGLAALPLVLGLAVDHGVVVSHDLAHGENHGINRAIIVSSFTAVTGMGLLALAEHPALRSMGQIIFVGLIIEMLAALWLLPLLSREQTGEFL